MELLFILLAAMIGLPVLAYMVMKFGRSGYLRANKEQQKQKDNDE